MSRIALALTIALVLFIPAAGAHDYAVGDIVIGHPWSRATPPSAPAAAGFLTLTNKGASADRLIAVRSPSAGKSEIHEMKMEGNIMRMRELENGLEIPAGATVKLAPGGYHLMLMELRAPFAKDTRVAVTLVFEKAGSIDIELMVTAMGAADHRH